MISPLGEMSAKLTEGFSQFKSYKKDIPYFYMQ